MKKLTSYILISLLLTATYSRAAEKIEPYDEKTCLEIYNAIGLFLYLADTEWKAKNNEKGLLFSSAAANYATTYSVVCDKD
jgi:hypothetical protein